MPEPYSSGEPARAGTEGRDDELARLASEHQRDLDALAAKRLRIGAILTAVMLVIYFGFILLIAFDKEGMGKLITDGLSWGILLGVLVILATWAVTYVYVRWANKVYEPEIRRLRG